MEKCIYCGEVDYFEGSDCEVILAWRRQCAAMEARAKFKVLRKETNGLR